MTNFYITYVNLDSGEADDDFYYLTVNFDSHLNWVWIMMPNPTNQVQVTESGTKVKVPKGQTVNVGGWNFADGWGEGGNDPATPFVMDGDKTLTIFSKADGSTTEPQPPTTYVSGTVTLRLNNVNNPGGNGYLVLNEASNSFYGITDTRISTTYEFNFNNVALNEPIRLVLQTNLGISLGSAVGTPRNCTYNSGNLMPTSDGFSITINCS